MVQQGGTVSLMSNVQRRRSGIYECRVQLPKKIAGKLAPEHLRRSFPDLINAKTGCFKHEIARSLNTSDPETAKKLGRKESPRLHDIIERAVAALAHRRAPQAAVDFEEIANDIAADFLSWDEEEREGDDRRHLPAAMGRSALPDLVPLAFDRDELGMEQDHFIAHGVSTAENIVLRFKEWHGDWRLGVITKAHAREFRDALAKMPSRLPDRLRKLPLKELLRRDLSDLPPRSATTVNKQLTILAAIVSNAQRDGLLDSMPSFVSPFDKDVKLRIDAREIEEREPFDVADLRALFGTAVFSEGKRPKGGGGEAAFWFPLIALFSGMRLSEMAGLLIGDLRRDEETGRWFFDVRPNSERSVKNASSIRRVPVHRELERIGLLRYRESLSAKGSRLDDSLWPDVGSAEKSEDRATTPWSKWFGRYLRTKAGITSSRKVFHSFRHTFKRMARSAELSEELHDALTGHSGGGRVGRSYGRGYAFDTFASAIDRLAMPNETGLSSLTWPMR